MKPKFILIALLLLGVSLGARAGSVTVLDDRHLAEAKGGFCPFEICEDAPGTGICETIPPETLCDLAKCVYGVRTVGSVTVYECLFTGKYTCSNPENYRQCILHFSLSFCSYGSDLQCGMIVEPDCKPNVEDRSCICSVVEIDSPCDWTDCVETDL